MRIPSLVSSLLTAALVATACAGSTPQHTAYLLGPGAAAPSGLIEVPQRVGLRGVSIAPYLDQVGIVVETAPGQVRPARYHTWAEPLEEGLRTYLRAEISRALGYEISAHPGDRAFDLTVDLHVERLHATLEGSASAVAAYRISQPGGATAEYRFNESHPLPREGYPGVVDAESALAKKLAEAIAAAVAGMPTR